MQIILQPLAFVHNNRIGRDDDYWGDVISEIELAEDVPAMAFDGIDTFSHLEIIFYFDQADPGKAVYKHHPRGNPDWPEVGIFAQRKSDRPNRLGLTVAELIGRKGRVIRVKNLDAINGTPVLDIKPVIREFLPPGNTRQPAWCSELMKDYWK